MYTKILLASIIIIGYSFGIRTNYKKDIGKNKLAKVINPIFVIGIFIFYFSSSYDKITWLSNSEQTPFEILNNKVNIVPPLVNIITWFLYLILSITIIILSWGLIFRKPNYRKFFLKVIPVLWLLECFEINRIIEDNFGANYKILILSIVLLTILWVAIYLLYSSKLMAKFYCQE